MTNPVAHFRFEELALGLGLDMTVEGLEEEIARGEALLAAMERAADEASERSGQAERIANVVVDLCQATQRELAAECVARGVLTERDRQEILELETVRAVVAFMKESLKERRAANPS